MTPARRDRYPLLRWWPLLLALLLAAGLAPARSTSATNQLPPGTVSWIYDGDTLKVEGYGKVRLLGIDTPEAQDSERDRFFLQQGIQRPSLRSGAAQAREFNIRLVKGRRVQLSFDREERDRYGRLLAYVTLPDGRLLNRMLLEEGLALVYRRFDFALKKDFLAAEKRARLTGRGFWPER